MQRSMETGRGDNKPERNQHLIAGHHYPHLTLPHPAGPRLYLTTLPFTAPCLHSAYIRRS
ncbi:hypothetical protein E2C01_051084 [Portunus trituberculatus]|uniref:Uncharacterized protein n=1 Tax=Portunus trituberculatus TaxID=210409 RepID=A0A5B7GA18_PORTR|nr:hypothetical protein [Portunus trituberculatus]